MRLKKFILIILVLGHSLSYSTGEKMNNELKEAPQKILSEYMESLGEKENPELTPLLGGRSGAGIYQFSYQKQKYVLRLFAAMENQVGRKREALITQVLGEQGMAPKVFYIDPNYQGMIIGFVPGETLRPSQIDEALLKQFALFLRTLHQTEMEKPLKSDSYFKRGREWLEKAKERQAEYPKEAEALIKQFKQLSEQLEPLLENEQLIHNDLISRNILYDGHQFTLVDWPASGVGDKFWDFIDFADFQNLSDEQAKQFMRFYFEREIKQAEWDKFVALRPIPTIVRFIGGFAFMSPLKSKEDLELRLKNNVLISFSQLMNDFAEDTMDIDNWDLVLIFLKEAQRQVNQPVFTEAVKRLSQ